VKEATDSVYMCEWERWWGHAPTPLSQKLLSPHWKKFVKPKPEWNFTRKTCINNVF